MIIKVIIIVLTGGVVVAQSLKQVPCLGGRGFETKSIYKIYNYDKACIVNFHVPRI